MRAARPPWAATADPDTLGAAAASRWPRLPLEFEALDVAWRGGRGGILMRCAGAEHARRASRAARRLTELGLESVEATEDDAGCGHASARASAAAQAALLRVTAPRVDLPAVLRAADAVDGTLVGRAALGTSYVEVAAERIAELRAALPAAALSRSCSTPRRRSATSRTCGASLGAGDDADAGDQGGF